MFAKKKKFTAVCPTCRTLSVSSDAAVVNAVAVAHEDTHSWPGGSHSVSIR